MNSRLKLLTRAVWFTVFALVLIAIQTWKPEVTKSYGTISDLAVSVSDSTKSATATYTVTFTPEHAISQYGGKINVQIFGPSGYTSGTSTSNNVPNFNSATVANGTTPSTINFSYSNWNGATFTTSSDIAAGTAITLIIGNVVNSGFGGYYFAHVWTSNYWSDIDGTSNWASDYNSPYFEIGTNTNITGRITDSDGTTAVPFTSISLSSIGGSYSYYYTYTDKNGYYGIGDIPAGTYNYYIYGPSTYGTNKTYFPPSNTTVTIPSSGTLTKNASFLAATKTFSGKVTKNSLDGTAVTNAYVYASKVGGNGYANATVDSSGNYSMLLTGGMWRIGLYASTWPADWIYTVWDETVTFADDSTSETKTKNFIVEAVNSTITGRIVKPGGTSIAQYSSGISFTSGSKYFYASVDSSGYFTTKVTKGTFAVTGWNSDSTYSFPKVDNVTIGENESKDIGTITLVEKTDSITGTIKDNTGAAVSGAYVNAWKNDGTYDWGNATSGSDGTYTIKVTPGVWQISTYPQWNSDYAYNGKPTSVTVTSGTPAIKNFVFQKITAKIVGTITDQNGNTINDLYSWVSANDGSSEWGYIGTSIDKGTFTLRVPAGTWDIQANIYHPDYSSPDPAKVTIADNETKTITLQALKNDATISGTFYDESGNKITNKWISVYATKGKYGSWQNATVDQSNGTYSLKVSAGTWKIGWWIDQSLGYSSGYGQDVEVTVASSESKVQDITLKKSDSTISGKTLKSDGSALPWSWITADTRDSNEKKSADMYYYNNGASSNSSGDYEIKVPAGTYWVGGSMYWGSGYINPKRQKVTVSATEPATVNLTFRTADSTISGTVTGGGTASSYITAWSEDGGYSETSSNNEGAYSLSASSGTTWHVKAIQKSNKDVYKSSEYIIDLGSTTSATQDLVLVKQDFTLPESKSVTFDPTKQVTITLDDNSNLLVPANTIATSGEITITVEPIVDLAEESDAKPIDYGYEMTATDGTGKEISTFNGNVIIEDTYTDKALSDSKVIDAGELVAAYYDEAKSSWEEISGTVNEIEKAVTYQTNHFTKFALVTASDTTPPAAPTEIKATAGDAKAVLNWKNSTTSDFAGIKIYKSTTSGSLGDLATTVTNTTTTSETITSLDNGTTYYFTVRTYDTSGNISTNTVQVSAKPGMLPVTGENWKSWASLLLLSTFILVTTLRSLKRKMAYAKARF